MYMNSSRRYTWVAFSSWAFLLFRIIFVGLVCCGVRDKYLRISHLWIGIAGSFAVYLPVGVQLLNNNNNKNEVEGSNAGRIMEL